MNWFVHVRQPLFNHNNWFIYSIHILNQHKSYWTLLSTILNTGLYLHIILYIWIFPRYLLFYSIFNKIPRDKHIYNNNQSLNVQNACCKSTIFLPDSISTILNLWTIADHLVYFNKNLLLAHLTQRVMWAILITWRPSSSSVVRRPSVVRRTS